MSGNSQIEIQYMFSGFYRIKFPITDVFTVVAQVRDQWTHKNVCDPKHEWLRVYKNGEDITGSMLDMALGMQPKPHTKNLWQLIDMLQTNLSMTGDEPW